MDAIAQLWPLWIGDLGRIFSTLIGEGRCCTWVPDWNILKSWDHDLGNLESIHETQNMQSSKNFQLSADGWFSATRKSTANNDLDGSWWLLVIVGAVRLKSFENNLFGCCFRKRHGPQNMFVRGGLYYNTFQDTSKWRECAFFWVFSAFSQDQNIVIQKPSKREKLIPKGKRPWRTSDLSASLGHLL